MAELVVWQVAARPVVEYGSDVRSCSSEHSEQKLEVLQERVGRALIGVSWRFPGVVVRGELGLEKMKYRRHGRAEKYAGRVRAMSAKCWPKIVGSSGGTYGGKRDMGRLCLSPNGTVQID